MHNQELLHTGCRAPRRVKVPAICAVTLLSAAAAFAQPQDRRVGIPQNGHQKETGASPARTPSRILPRRPLPGAVRPATGDTAGIPTPLPVEDGGDARRDAAIDRLVRETPERPLAEDRVRPLIRGSVAALVLLDSNNPHPPQPTPRGPLVAGNVIQGCAVATEVPNRWRLFPQLNQPSDDALLKGPCPSPDVMRLKNPVLLPRVPWKRYGDPNLDAIYAHTKLWDPFNRNILKGDFPFAGRRGFFSFTGVSETTFETKRLPIGSGASAADPGEYTFFGRGEIGLVSQNFRFSMDLFRGSAGFKPVDWELRITPEFNINYTLAREQGVINIDVRQQLRRTDSNVGMQEAFVEKRLFSEQAHFDFTSLRLGIQRFTSDFRGFVFSDEQPGARLFGTFHNNIFQYNLAYFEMLEKDTNSGLNRWRLRQQQVAVANLYIADFLTKGYTLNLSALYNHDQPTFLIDKNGFLVRPAAIGNPPLSGKKIRAMYAGVTGDGHIGRISISNAFYQAFGRDDNNSIPLTKPAQHINAQLAALELSYEKDWYTYKVSAFYTSGDGNLNDGQAKGFDGIVPNQQFAGGGFLGNPALADRGLLNNAFAGGGINFLNREAVPLSDVGVNLFAPNNLMPTMRSGLFEGQANFINPGIGLVNAGFIAKITPKLQGTLNVNYAKFIRTEVLQAVLFQGHIRHGIGLDTGVGFQYRPLLTDNIVIFAGFGSLFPAQGFKDIYTGRTLFDGFINLRLLF